MSQFQTILDKVSAIEASNRTKGGIFEKISVHLLKEKNTQGEYKSIKLWGEWEHRDGKDTGIDIVAETKDGEFVAVQCKFYMKSELKLNDLTSYFTKLQSGVGDIKFSKGILIVTCDLNQHIQNEIYQINKHMPLELITLQDFLYSSIDWDLFDPEKDKDIKLHARKTPLNHQKEVLSALDSYFKDPKNTRGKLIMACGTGKTFVSLKSVEMLTNPKDSITLFLAPSIALVGQTLREYTAQKSQNFTACVICSDSTAARGEDDLDPSELPLPPSTNPRAIIEAYKKAQSNQERFIIFSTYQSVQRIQEAQNLDPQNKLPQIDLIICDEAHRSVGALYTSIIKGQEENDIKTQNAFTICHDNNKINAKRRIYMTATPKIYSDKQKTKAAEKDNEVFSMDDEAIFGKSIYEIRFDRAVREKLLTDYKVIILTIKKETYTQIANNAIAKLKASGMSKLNEKLVDLDFVCKIIGTHKGLVKSDLKILDSTDQNDNAYITDTDKTPSQRALNFCRNIATSKNIKESFQTIIDCYDTEMKTKTKDHTIHIDHIDGTMNANTRFEKLSELEKTKDKTCELITNAKCLSEGVDIPALDSVVFFDGRSAMVDIIQAVGRVMRKAPNKEIGYIILPIALSEAEIKNLDKAVDNTNFKNIWNILKALRSHDESLVSEASFKEKIKIATILADSTSDETNPDKKPTNAQKDKEKAQKQKEAKEHMQGHLDLIQTSLNDIADAVYNVLPTKLGDKHYWESFSAKTGKIVQDLNLRLNAYFKENPNILREFVKSLQEAIHPNIKESESIDMLASHIVTKPIFDTIFGEAMNHNPIGNALDLAFNRLKDLGLENEELKGLDTLYKSIKENVAIAQTESDKQRLIKDLYDTFFKTAFKKQSERLGIVYTPIEVIDFILHSTNALLKRHFSTDFNDKQVKIFDAFTGTGAFIARLLSSDNDLIATPNLKDRFNNGIYAQDINILAYYIALINITQTAQNRDPNLAQFAHIALADSLNYLEDKQDYGLFSDYYKDLLENKKTQDYINTESIQVFIGNPPYSSGQKSQNDNNANFPHPKLESHIRETYGKDSAAQSAKNTRDTLIQAIRMASDRVLKEGWGVIGFVVNGGFIDAKSADGFRKCLFNEFEDIYIVNLRGNARTQGELRKQEGDGIFDSGSRASVALLFLVKSKVKKDHALHYYEVGDYWDRIKKLDFLSTNKSIENIDFIQITPNQKGDWINQRNEHFYTFLPLKLKKSKNKNIIFSINSNGFLGARDSWVWNFDQTTLKESMEKCIHTYNENLANFDSNAFREKHKGVKSSDLYKMLTSDEISTDESQISWTDALKNKLINNKEIENFSKEKIRIATYRPFVKSYLYYDKTWNHRHHQMNKIFPTAESENLVICIADSNALILNSMPDYSVLTDYQAYPLYQYGKSPDSNILNAATKRERERERERSKRLKSNTPSAIGA
ncbi:type ISP restriction/modification enzyme [Helicobacter sp. 12S02634-8]|uniref:type ISP restriction/modification enzyme n=1 Tax=Helicobacter sp. 12S02634-8 TaxID=1476199 RepID=UPI0026BD2658